MPLLGPRLRAVREARSLSLSDAAAASGLHRMAIWKCEHDRVSVSVRLILALAYAYRVEPGELLPTLAELDAERRE